MTTAASWSYQNPVRVRFGPDCINELPALVGSGSVLLVTSHVFATNGLIDHVKCLLAANDVCVLNNVQPNPTLEQLAADVRTLAGRQNDTVLAIGGGSVIDTAKVLSMAVPTASSGFSLRQHFENNQPLPNYRPPQFIAVPTTAGTGSEATPFATVWEPTTGKKYSLNSNRLFASVALLDPELTLSLPDDVTISTALDTLSHGLEAVWNRNATPVADLQAKRAIALVLETLPPLLEAPKDLELRGRMLQASLLGGMAISNTRTALAHSISYPLTARFGLPHGWACSFTLPALLGFNAVSDDGRLAGLARLLGHSSIGGLQAALVDFLNQLGVNSILQRHQIRGGTLRALMPEMITPNRSDNNLRAAHQEDLAGIITKTESYFPALKD